MVICPGNHDVDWNISKVDRTRRFDNYLVFLSEFYGMELFRELYPLVSWDLLINSPRPKPMDIVSRQVFPKDGLLFLSLNSCVYETEEHHYGYVSGKQLRNCTTTLDGVLDDDSLVRIVIMHHHLHPFPEPVSFTPGGDHWHDQTTIRDSALVEKYLEKNNFDIILHGHKHKSQIRETVVRDPTLDDSAPSLIVCGAGSCGVQSKELEHNVPNHYQVLELLNAPRRQGVDFVRVEWREIALAPGAEWVTNRTWILRG